MGWNLYTKYLSIRLKSQMQYKTSFWLTTVGQFLISFSTLAGMLFLFTRFHQVEGFSLEEVLLCFASVLMSFSLSECFARGFDGFATMLGNGEFDRILVRPRGLVFQVLASKMDFSRLGKLGQAVLVFIYAIPASGIAWTPAKVGVLALMVIGGVVVFSGLFLLYASVCFFTTEGLEVFNIFTDGGREFASYPLIIYGKQVLAFTTFVVPLGLVQYYPLLYVLGRSENPLLGLCPLFSFVFIIPCYLMWRLGVRHFRSTGS